MLKRVLGFLAVIAVVFTSAGSAQAKPVQAREPVADGRPLSQWVRDLKAESQQMMAEEINDEIAASARRALKRIDPSAVPATE
jgi:D-alanyl-D-alanine carboxypeptidase